MEKMQFDFSALRGRIIERYGSCAAFADAIGMPRDALSSRLRNKISFKPEEIYAICEPDVLDIPEAGIRKYFFTLKVLTRCTKSAIM